MNVLLLAATLCFGHDCRPVDGIKFPIEAKAQARPFVWTSADGKSIVFGTAEANAKEIDLGSKDLREVTLSVRGSAARGWPAETTIALRSGPKTPEWTTVVLAKAIANLATIRAPRGRYRLTIAAPHHRIDSRALALDSNVALREVVLAPAPVISGTVVTRGEKGDVPVAGAFVARSDEKLAGTTNEEGAFRVELADPLPDQLVVSHAGFATKIVPLERQLPPDVNLGAIQLAAGHTLTLHVKLPDALDPKNVLVRLAADTKQKYETTLLLTRKAEPEVVLHDIAPGSYTIIVTGTDPLERLEVPLTMEEKDEERTIAIAPFRVQGSAKIGQAPLADGAIHINDRTGWRAEMPVHDGAFSGVLWQPGKLSAYLQFQGSGEFVTSPELGADPSAWDIVLKDRRIAGRIVDAETKEPVEKATMSLQIGYPDGRHGYTNAEVRDGAYSILATKAGTYELRVQAPGYVNDSAKIEIAETDEGTRTRDFTLLRGIKATIEVVSAAGQPIAGAEVDEGLSSDGFNPARVYRTDGAGRLTLQFRPDETRTLYVMPQEGSFAVAHLTAPRDERPLQIVVPPATGSLHVTMKRAPDADSYPNVVMRYNGEMLPPFAMRGAGVLAPTPNERVYQRLPAGLYELWAVQFPPGAFLEKLIGWVPRTPPVRVGVTSGEAVAEVAAQFVQ